MNLMLILMRACTAARRLVVLQLMAVPQELGTHTRSQPLTRRELLVVPLLGLLHAGRQGLGDVPLSLPEGVGDGCVVKCGVGTRGTQVPGWAVGPRLGAKVGFQVLACGFGWHGQTLGRKGAWARCRLRDHALGAVVWLLRLLTFAGSDPRGIAAQVGIAARCSDSPAQLFAVVRDARAHVHAEDLSRGRVGRGMKAVRVRVREQLPGLRVRGLGTRTVDSGAGAGWDMGRERRCTSCYIWTVW